MADPKYENLPGIAYDQPDVYESGDLPEADQLDDGISDDENECIEKLHLSVKDSFERFKGKSLTGSVDFSDRLSRKIRTGYRSGDWELSGEGEAETPFQKYQRLKLETSELLEQIVEQQTKTAEDDKVELKKLEEQVAMTKKVLEGLNLSENESSNNEKLQELLLRVGDKKPASSKGTAHIKMKADSYSLQQSTHIAQLEHRLHALEKVTGLRDEESLRRIKQATGENTLSGAAAILAGQASMLRPADVASAEARVSTLLSNMDALKAASNIDPERTKKINELYDMLRQIEGISHVEILERMEALEALHNQASNFGKSLSDLEALQNNISSSVQSNKTLLQGVQEVFVHSLEQIKLEINKLEERIDKMTKK